MNLFYSITLYLWDYIFSIIDKNEIKILRIICKDFRNISINYWNQNIPNKEVNNYFINNQKLKFNIRFIILQYQQFDFEKLINNNDLLFISCQYGYLEIVKLLLENSANINKKNNNGMNSLIYAFMYGNLEIVKLLIKNGADINDNNNKTSLIFACNFGHLEIVKLLIKNGANTTLMLASSNGNLEIIKLLIENDAK